MAFAQDEPRLSPYRKLLLQLSSELSSNDLEKLKFAAIDVIPRGMTENVSNGFELFDVLEKDGRITPQNLSLLEDMLRSIGRMDLALNVQLFSNSLSNDDPSRIPFDGDADDDVHDGTDTNYNSEENGSAVPGNRNGIPSNKDGADGEDVPDGFGDESDEDHEAASNIRTRSMDTVSRVRRERLETEQLVSCENPALFMYSPANASNFSHSGGSQYAAYKVEGRTFQQSDGNHGALGARGPAPRHESAIGQCNRLQHDPSVGPAPVRYVNYLAYEGYSVEIIGGKHFKTPDGEFVEIKSGTQYKIHVKNSRAYGCNLDISIDGYDVGGWVVDAGQELSIERSAYEAKKFTFYRVKTAPKEAGIESGRSENGVVKCVFIPEAFLDIPVIISGSPQPLVVNIAPSATFGDLKYEVQSKLNASPDADQILALNDKVMPNSTRLSRALKSPGNLRLLDSEVEITIQTSAKEIFHVKIHPGKAKVIDLMEQIERKLEIPIKDQKLFHGKAQLSDAPGRGLPEQLICSLDPNVVVIVPEYIQITVEDVLSGATNIVKIDKKKTLIDLMEEIPSCKSLQENEEATFYVRGQPLCPSKEDGSLESLGISSGSKVQVEVKIAFIEIIVTALSRILPMRSSRFRCRPDETFRDLLKSVKARGNIKKLEGATFSMQERVFDPEKDVGPLQDYGIKHRSTLQLNLAEAQSSKDPSMSQEDKELIERHQVECVKLRKKVFRKQDRDERQGLGAEAPYDRLGARDMMLAPSFGLTGTAQGSSADEEELGFDVWLGAPRFSTKRFASRPRYTQGSTKSFARPSCYRLDAEERVLNERDPAWRAGGTTLQGYSTQHFMPADPIKVDPSRKVVLELRLVAREDETEVVFPKEEFKPLSTLHPPAVQE